MSDCGLTLSSATYSTSNMKSNSQIMILADLYIINRCEYYIYTVKVTSECKMYHEFSNGGHMITEFIIMI